MPPITLKRLLWFWGDIFAYACFIFILASVILTGFMAETVPSQGASYHIAMVNQILEMNGLKAGQDVLLPNGELWHVDDLTITERDIDEKHVIVMPRISAHRIK